MFFYGSIMMILGILSSVIGAMIPILIKIKSKNYIASLYQLTSGIMVGIVCITMIPESIDISGMKVTFLGIIIGTSCVLFMDYFISHINRNQKINKMILIICSMAFHNMIEGIAVGASIEYSYSFGISVFLAMFLHDIPEGMIVGVANMSNQKEIKQIIKNSCLVGLFFGIGVLIGGIFGNMSKYYTSLFLSISAGAMLYIVTTALIPDETNENKSFFSPICFILGILISIAIIKL